MRAYRTYQFNIILTVLCLALAVCIPDRIVYAEDSVVLERISDGGTREVVFPENGSIYLNLDGHIAGIGEPVNGENKSFEHRKEWEGSRVCFGRWNHLAVTYHVLDPVTTDYSGESDVKTMLLDCAVSLQKLPYMEGDGAEPSWEDSYVRGWLNGDAFLYNEECFTGPERAAMTCSVKREPLESDSEKVSVTRVNIWGPITYRYLKFTPLMGDQIFLLDARELTNTEYGFQRAEVGVVYTSLGTTNKRKALYEEDDYRWGLFMVRTNLVESTRRGNRTEDSAFIYCNEYGDFDIEDFKLSVEGSYKIIKPQGKIRHCIGCFGCWIKTPGRCVIHDGYEDTGIDMGKCTELIFVSRCCYGSVSPFVKTVQDRAISYIHPDFVIRKGEMHHKRRYRNVISLSAYFYGEHITEAEKETAREILEANADNYDGSVKNVFFCESVKELDGIIL